MHPTTTESPFQSAMREQGRGVQRKLARHLGCEEAEVSRWMAGMRVPEKYHGSIAQFLRRKRSELFA